jgi:tripartite-type tricarboxylate transporter receptor subunit TctC
MVRLRPVLLVVVLLACAVISATPMPAVAQADYPNRAIRIIVPIPPGAAADTLPRVVAEKLSAKWGQPVIVENRPGAALNIGAEAVARAEPDGYTLLASPPPPISVNQSLYPKLAFDPNAFVPVTIMASLPNVLMLHPKTPGSNLNELIAYAKANPDKLTYASAGSGSTPHLAMEMLKSMAGIKLVHVPYKGLAPALTDLHAGHVHMMFDNLGNALQPVQAGRLKGLGIGSPKRISALPNVPAMAESFPGFVSETWFGVVAPPKTPPEIVAKLSAAIQEALKQPDVAKRIQDMSLTPVGSSPAETAAFIQEDRERWRKVITSAGIKAE